VRRIGEGPILDEIHTGTTSSPVSGTLAAHDGVLAEAAALGLSKRDYAVVST
jgi:hypothetical protein